MARRKVPVDEGYPEICRNTPAKFRPMLRVA
jgi:hypothetical protein